jgi:hypothetical protein
MKRLIKPTNRKRISDLLPNLDGSVTCGCKKEAHWNMFRLLAFSAYRDEETGAVRVGRESVARCEGKQHLVQSNGYTAKPFLTHFINFILPPGTASLVLDADGRDWSVSTWEEIFPGQSVKTGEGKQRRVLVNWPPEVQQAIDDELSGLYAHEESVYIDTGLKRSVKRERELLKADREEAANLVAIADSPRARYMAQYLNNLPTNKFTALADNFTAAEQEVNKISNPHAKRVQKLILDTIKERPIPVYVPTKNSDRLFTMGASMQNLKKKVRKALTQGWVEFDLSSAQLAIIAHQWNVPEVIEFLESGKNLWSDLVSHYGLNNLSPDQFDKLKSTLKDHTYGIIFGMGEERLISELNTDLSDFGVVDGGKLFLEHPVMKAVLAARRERIKDLLKTGFIIETFDAPSPYDAPTLKTTVVTKKNVLSILAQQAQAMEQVLIYPAFQLTNETTDFQITLYQFDGFSVSFSDKSKQAYWTQKICDVVNQMCEAVGVHSFLTWEENQIAQTVPSQTTSSSEVVSNMEVQVRTVMEVCPEIMDIKKEPGEPLPDSIEGTNLTHLNLDENGSFVKRISATIAAL